jgi:hypothetical protein
MIPHRAVRAAVAEMIQNHAEWDIWATFTFSDNVSPETASAILKRWARRVATRAATHFKLAYVRENQSGGCPHFHVLLSHPPEAFDALRPRWLEENWRRSSPKAGFARVEYFDPERAAACAEYMAKDGEVEFQVACPREPRCRRKRCVEAKRLPWDDGGW